MASLAGFIIGLCGFCGRSYHRSAWLLWQVKSQVCVASVAGHIPGLRGVCSRSYPRSVWLLWQVISQVCAACAAAHALELVCRQAQAQAESPMGQRSGSLVTKRKRGKLTLLVHPAPSPACTCAPSPVQDCKGAAGWLPLELP